MPFTINPDASIDELPKVGKFREDIAQIGPDYDEQHCMGLRVACDKRDYQGTDGILPAGTDETLLVAVNQLPMLKRLQEERARQGHGLKYVEIGCGSGFDGIAADLFLNDDNARYPSQVYLTDINPRAVRKASGSVKLNEARHTTVLPPQPFSEKLRDAHGKRVFEPGTVDAMYINPPFFQVYPGTSKQAPSYAAAGTSDGLDVFNDYFEGMPKLLAPGGVIFGCTMTPVFRDTQGEKVTALETAAKKLGAKSKVEYFHIMKPVDTKKFLSEQYAKTREFLMRKGDLLEARQLDIWIEKNSKQFPETAFVYFEASNQGGHGQIEEMKREHWKNHSKDWGYRELIHGISNQTAAKLYNEHRVAML